MFDLASSPQAYVYEEPTSAYLNALQGSKSYAPNCIETLFNRIFVEEMWEHPQALTYLGFFEKWGVHQHNGLLDDYSITRAQRSIDLAKSHWISLLAFPTEDLSLEQQLSREAILWTLKQTIDGEPFLFHDYPINQMRGVPQYLASLLTNAHPIEDREEYLSRLRQIEKQFQQVIERLEHQKKMGIVAPRFAIEKSIIGLEKWMSIPIEKHPLYLRMPTVAVKEVLENQVFPAYQMLIDALQENLKDMSSEDGVWALPNGDAYYAHCLKSYTTLDITPEEVHLLGLKEVERIEQEIERLFKQEGLWNPELSVGKHLELLSQNPKFYYPNTDEGRQAVLKKFEEIIERSRRTLGPLFSTQPKTPVIIKSVPAHEENGAPAAYYSSPSLDGSRPGMFFVNLRDLSTIPTYTMETLAIHEAEPGHHFQIALVRESDAHMIRKTSFNSAYVEGWALYTEKLAFEQGFYSSALDQIGHLQAELLRAARLVVDTGIHWRRWTREVAIDYLSLVTGEHLPSVVSEIERYFVLPGQACSYKMGQMKILELRAQEKERLGDAFDLAEFHSYILKRGVLPLSML